MSDRDTCLKKILQASEANVIAGFVDSSRVWYCYASLQAFIAS
jgi:hypothetical protein